MRIAIITFSCMNTNYGSILQAYSLKIFLESLGHNVEFIKYREFHKIYPQNISALLKYFLVRLYKLFQIRRFKKRNTNFVKFIENNLPHTRLFTSEQDLEKNLGVYDAYICGSDQIWNIPVLGGIRAPYFLRFAPEHSKRISYAASLGEYDIKDNYKEDFKMYLTSIDVISVREYKSIEYLKEITDKKIQHVLDPVFLLSPQQWNLISSKFSLPKHDYAICYFVRRNKLANYMVKKLKQKYNITIYNISDNLINVPYTSNKYAACGPDDFIHLIKNARFCVGTSFHLAAFSIIFGKQVFIAGSEHNKERVESILKLVGMEDHLFFSKEEADQLLKINFNYSANRDELIDRIRFSQDFLINNLEHGK